MKTFHHTVLFFAVVSASAASQFDNCAWTKWTDRDDPSGTGDWESIVDWPEDRRCPYGEWPENVMDIEARRISDKAPAYFTDQSFRHYDTTTGFACVNEDQTQGGCSDYEARLCCQVPEPSSPACDLFCSNRT